MLNQRSSFILCILFVMCYYSYGACPPLKATISTNITCKYNETVLNNCLTPIEGTNAVLSCNQFYEEDTIKTNPNRFCTEDSWDAPIPNCYPTQYKTEDVNYTNYRIIIAAVAVLFVITLVAVNLLQLTLQRNKRLKKRRVIASTSLQLKINEESSFQ